MVILQAQQLLEIISTLVSILLVQQMISTNTPSAADDISNSINSPSAPDNINISVNTVADTDVILCHRHWASISK
nr:unnamed protein product [Callosobruchus analis]